MTNADILAIFLRNSCISGGKIKCLQQKLRFAYADDLLN